METSFLELPEEDDDDLQRGPADVEIAANSPT